MLSVPGFSSACTASAITTRSVPYRYGARSNPGVPRSRISTFEPHSYLQRNISMAKGPKPSSPINTFPKPMTHTRVGVGNAVHRWNGRGSGFMTFLCVSLDRRSCSQDFHLSDFAAACIQRVTCAGHARIEGVHGAEYFQRLHRIGHRVGKERTLVRPGNAFLVTRAGVPSGRHNRLLVGESPLLDDNPMRKRAAWRFMHSHTLDFVLRELGWIVGGVVAFENVGGEQLPMLECEVGEHGCADRAGKVTPHGRLQILRRHTRTMDRGNSAESGVRPFVRERMAGGVADENIRKRTDLHRLTVVAWRFYPRVLPVVLEVGVVGIGLAFPGPLRAFSSIPRVRNILGNRCADGLVMPIFDRPHGTEIPIHNDAPGKIELGGLRVHRKVRDGKIIRHAASIMEPLGVGGGEQAGIYEIG